MAEFGDVMAEFHKLPLPAKIAAGGAVGVVALIGYARWRSQASNPNPSQATFSGADTGGGISTNAPAPSSDGSSSGGSAPVTFTVGPNPPTTKIVAPFSGGGTGPDVNPGNGLKWVPGQGWIRSGQPISSGGGGNPLHLSPRTPAHAAQSALLAHQLRQITPRRVVTDIRSNYLPRRPGTNHTLH